MKRILSLAGTIFLISCGHSQLVSHLEGSDSVAVIYKQQATGAVIKIVGTSGNYAIQDLLTFTGSGKTAEFKCGYDGDILFYKKGIQAGEVYFNYTTDGCHHFVIMKDGKATATQMSNEATDFLKLLAASNQ